MRVSTPLRRAFSCISGGASWSTAPQRRSGSRSASNTGGRNSALRRISSVSSSPGTESNPVCTIPELVPLAASPTSGSASSSTTAAPRRASASALAHPTTPAPITATSASKAKFLLTAVRRPA